MPNQVVAVHAKGAHLFSKDSVPCIELLQGLGVEGDAHCGVTVKHRSRVAKDPAQANLRQVHLIHLELLDELAGKTGVMGVVLASGSVAPGDCIAITHTPQSHMPLQPV